MIQPAATVQPAPCTIPLYIYREYTIGPDSHGIRKSAGNNSSRSDDFKEIIVHSEKYEGDDYRRERAMVRAC